MMTEEDRYEAYFTPGPVAEQGLRLVSLLRTTAPQSLCDLGTGPGVFGQRARLVWPGVERVGIEVRASEARAARHYETFLAGDFFEIGRELGGFDLVVSNPPFSRTREAMMLARLLLAPRGIALFFVRASWGTAKKDYPWLRRHLPTLQADLVGRVNMRRGKSRRGHEMTGDNVGHKWLVMERRGRSAPWLTMLLPPLPGESRRWTVRPGTERTVLPLESQFWPRIGGPDEDDSEAGELAGRAQAARFAPASGEEQSPDGVLARGAARPRVQRETGLARATCTPRPRSEGRGSARG